MPATTTTESVEHTIVQLKGDDVDNIKTVGDVIDPVVVRAG